MKTMLRLVWSGFICLTIAQAATVGPKVGKGAGKGSGEAGKRGMMANTKERMKGAKEGYEGRMLGKMDGDYKDKDGKGKKGDDWLLKRGVWEKQKPDTVAMVVREVMVSSVCNTSRQPQLNQGSVEFNVTDDFLNSTSGLSMCQKCFLQTPMDQIFTTEGGVTASKCTTTYLPEKFQKCGAMAMANNTEAEDVVACYKEGLKNSSIETCMESGRAIVDPVESFTNVSACLREAKQGMKKQLRLAMLDRAIGRSGCAASALLALKLFGGKIKASGMNWGEALDVAMEEEIDDDLMSRPWMETRPVQGRWKGRRNGGGGMEGNKAWDQRYGGRRPRRSQRDRGGQRGRGGRGGQGGYMGGRNGGMTRPGGGRMRPAGQQDKGPNQWNKGVTGWPDSKGGILGMKGKDRDEGKDGWMKDREGYNKGGDKREGDDDYNMDDDYEDDDDYEGYDDDSEETFGFF